MVNTVMSYNAVYNGLEKDDRNRLTALCVLVRRLPKRAILSNRRSHETSNRFEMVAISSGGIDGHWYGTCGLQV